MTRRPIYHADDDSESYAGDEVYEECEVCHQEFGGVCPINSADCPYAETDEEEDDEIPDFEDVENLDVLIGDDEEVEKIIEDDTEIPLEDLIDEDALEKEEEDVTPSKTVEELEAEELENAKSRRGRKKTERTPKVSASTAKKKKKK